MAISAMVPPTPIPTAAPVVSTLKLGLGVVVATVDAGVKESIAEIEPGHEIVGIVVAVFRVDVLLKLRVEVAVATVVSGVRVDVGLGVAVVDVAELVGAEVVNVLNLDAGRSLICQTSCSTGAQTVNGWAASVQVNAVVCGLPFPVQVPTTSDPDESSLLQSNMIQLVACE